MIRGISLSFVAEATGLEPISSESKSDDLTD